MVDVDIKKKENIYIYDNDELSICERKISCDC